MGNRDLEKEMSCREEFELLKTIQSHPNIIKPYEFIVTDSWLYNILEFAQGIELQKHIQNKKLHFQEVKIILVQLLGAIELLHKQNIYHKDIKPENIIINP